MSRKAPAAEVKRLARLRELARDRAKAERKLERAVLAAYGRGIGVRRIAAAIGQDHVTVWRTVRPRPGQPERWKGSPQGSPRMGKPKTQEKEGVSS